MAQVVDVFIASPSDVKKERRHAEDIVHLVSLKTREILDIALHTVSWPNFLPSATRCVTEPIQDRFSAKVRKCGIFVGILYERYGTEINETRQISGTEEEFDIAIKNRRSIEILTYFRRIPKSISTQKGIISQVAKLQSLQTRLRKLGLIDHTYEKPINFRERFILDLFETVVRIRTEAERKEQLQSFFRFGISDKRYSPSVLLGYPPIHKHIQEPTSIEKTPVRKTPIKHKYNWQERLLPNVVYEDMKCIQKIEAAVRLTGVQDISSVTIDHPRLVTEPGNRIWLCLPRNNIAQRKLAQLDGRPRFRFERRSDENRPHILWKPDNKNYIEIQSPMAKYMIFQKRPKRSPWHPKFGSIVARDFAVIGRFPRIDTKSLTRDDPYYHFFIAGIRGLGTWGAGWFIDRRPDELHRIVKDADNESSDPQALLEVTLSNYRIIDVKDVSHYDIDYFKNQMKDEVIKEIIDRFK